MCKSVLYDYSKLLCLFVRLGDSLAIICVTLTFISRDLGRNVALSTMGFWFRGHLPFKSLWYDYRAMYFLYWTVILREGALRKAPGM